MIRLILGLLLVVGGAGTLIHFNPTTFTALCHMVLGFFLMVWALTDEKVLDRLDDIRGVK